MVTEVGDTVAAFDLGMLSQVFGLDRTADGLPGRSFAVVAVEPGLIPTTSGFAVQVDHGLDRLRSADLIAVPSWTTREVEPPADLVAALHAAVARGARVMSVCSGAFLLAAAGLLDGAGGRRTGATRPHSRSASRRSRWIRTSSTSMRGAS